MIMSPADDFFFLPGGSVKSDGIPPARFSALGMPGQVNQPAACVPGVAANDFILLIRDEFVL